MPSILPASTLTSYVLLPALQGNSPGQKQCITDLFPAEAVRMCLYSFLQSRLPQGQAGGKHKEPVSVASQQEPEKQWVFAPGLSKQMLFLVRKTLDKLSVLPPSPHASTTCAQSAAAGTPVPPILLPYSWSRNTTKDKLKYPSLIKQLSQHSAPVVYIPFCF